MSRLAAGFILYRKSAKLQYLMLQTSYGEHHWTPPKGHVDEGEELFETALRETKEEAGLSESDFKLNSNIPPIELKYLVNGKPKVVTYWAGEVSKDSEVELSIEHIKYKWCDIDEACRLGKYADLKDALKLVNSYLTA